MKVLPARELVGDHEKLRALKLTESPVVHTECKVEEKVVVPVPVALFWRSRLEIIVEPYKATRRLVRAGRLDVLMKVVAALEGGFEVACLHACDRSQMSRRQDADALGSGELLKECGVGAGIFSHSSGSCEEDGEEVQPTMLGRQRWLFRSAGGPG